MKWQMEGEPGATERWRIVDRDRPAMTHRDCTHERQTQPGAALITAAGFVESSEALEDGRALIDWHT